MSARKRENGAAIIIPPRHQLCDHFFVLKIIEFIGQRNFAMARAKLNDEVIYVT
jgi:hypothetical protein